VIIRSLGIVKIVKSKILRWSGMHREFWWRTSLERR